MEWNPAETYALKRGRPCGRYKRPLTAAQREAYKRRGCPAPFPSRKVVCPDTGERWDSLSLCAAALGYRQPTTIWWHIKQRTPAKGRLLRYA